MGIETPDDADRRDLGRVLRRTQAVAILAELVRPATVEQLEFDGSHLTEVDAYGAAGASPRDRGPPRGR